MRHRRGFTLIELLVVLAVVATLLSLAAPRFIGSVDRAKEAVLKTNLKVIRQAIDKHLEDVGQRPESLDALVTGKYLKSLPMDPFTESNATWVEVSEATPAGKRLFDVRSGASVKARDGEDVSTW